MAHKIEKKMPTGINAQFVGEALNKKPWARSSH